MRLQIEILTGRFFYVDVDDGAKVADLVRVIGEQENLPTERLILIPYNHSLEKQQLLMLMKEDGTALVDYGLRDGSLLHLFFTLPPSPSSPDPVSTHLDLNFPDSLLAQSPHETGIPHDR